MKQEAVLRAGLKSISGYLASSYLLSFKKVNSLHFFSFFTVVLGYLGIELYFNYSVLSHLGNFNLEYWNTMGEIGRLLSGFAITLFIFKLSFKHTFLKFWQIAFVCIPIVYFAEQAFINIMVAQSTPEQRQKATALSVLPEVMDSQSLVYTNLNLNMNSGSGKVALGIVPVAILFSDSMFTQYTFSLPEVVNQFSQHSLGGKEGIYNNIYVPIQKDIEEVYNEKYVGVLKSLQEKVDSGWTSYLDQLKQYRVNPNVYKEKQRVLVVKKIKLFNLFLPEDFHLNDEQTFKESLRKTLVLGLAINKKQKELLEEPFMDFKTFIQNPMVQRYLVQQLQEKNLSLNNIDMSLSHDEFMTKVYPLIFNQIKQNVLNNIKNDAQLYKDGSALETIGKNSYKAIILPPIAIFFSLFGIVLNLINLSLIFFNYKNKVLKISVFLCTLFGVIYLPLLFHNSFIESGIFEKIITNMQSYYLFSQVLIWAVHLQVMLYNIISCLTFN